MSTPLLWVFDTIAFYPTGDRARPEPTRSGRLEVFNLVGTGRAEFNVFGFGEYTLELSVLVLSDTAAAALRGKHLAQGLLVGGGVNESQAILADVKLVRQREDYHEGTLTFKWSGTT